MLASLFGRCIGLSAVVCVLLLFFFPLAHGNFQSTHGPTTELRSKRAFLMLVFSIILAGLQIFAFLVHSLLLSSGRFWLNRTTRADLGEFRLSGAILRC
jgi:hypothetical protein